MLYIDITDKILRAFYYVYNELGYGFLEKVYEKSMVVELNLLGLNPSNQLPIDVYYKNNLVGSYYADIVVNNKIIIELKAAECLREEHEYQLINYLKAIDIEVGLLLNFGKKPQFVRKIYSNSRKSE